MEKDLTAVEVIGFGIRSEEDASKFYGDISKKVNNPLISTRYEQLAREEARHREILVKLYKEMTGDEFAPPKIPGKPETAGGKASETSDDIEKMLNIAIKREQDAQKFYRTAAEKSTDYSGQRILHYLADNEVGHEQILKAEFEAYLRDRDWYANNPDLQLEG